MGIEIEPHFTKKDIWQRSFQFGICVIKMTQQLPNTPVAWELVRQVIRSATSIAANISEGGGGSSKKEFIRYIEIAKKSALETYNWLLFIEKVFNLHDKMTILKQECNELVKILSSIAIKSKQ